MLYAKGKSAMKKFITRNVLISIFGLISAVIVISYAITYHMPDYFGIEGWYSLFNNISISYIAALIFYIFQVYKPECDKQKRAHMILNPAFSDLIEYMETAIACCRKYISINENGNVAINWLNKEEAIIYYVPQIEGSNDCGHRPATKKTKADLLEMDSVFKTKINALKERIDFRDCAPDILSILSELETADFFKSTLNTALMLEGTFVKFPDFQNKVDKFEEVKDVFKKACGVTKKFEIRDAKDLEIATCEAIYYKKALQVGSTEEFAEIAYREYINIKLKPVIKDETQRNQIVDEVFEDAMKVIRKQD